MKRNLKDRYRKQKDMDKSNKNNTVKSDLPVYYGAAAVLLIMACVCIILIFQNVFSGNTASSAAVSEKAQIIENIDETEELKISHAGLAGVEETKSEVRTDDTKPVLRSRS